MPILQAGDAVAGVANQCGTGTAILLGTFAGLCATAHTHPASDRFVERLLTTAGVHPDRCGRLLRRRRVLGDREAWFLINPADRDVSETVSLGGFSGARDLLGDALTAPAEGSVTVTVAAAAIRCLVLSR